MSSEVIPNRYSIREHETAGIDIAGLRFFAQVRHGFSVARQEPEHAPLDRPEQSHPNIEHLRSHLIIAVKTAKHKSLFRQICLETRRYSSGNSSPRVDLITIGK